MFESPWNDILELGPECYERFIDASKVPEITQLDINLSGISTLTGHYKVGRANPTAHTLVYVLDGSIKLHTEEMQQIVTETMLITLPASKPFLFELNSPTLSICWFDLDDTRYWRQLCSNKSTVEYCENGHQIYHLLGLIYYERNASLRQTAFTQLEYYLNNALNSPSVRSQESQRIKQLFREIEKKLHFTWTIDNMCELIHYSSPHLHRLCKNHFKRSPIQQLILLRMERAKYLLANTDWSIAQIAEQVGYQDIFNFSKRFKKSLGISPAKYRKQENSTNIP
jgi:AraC-like DNA-binding protein